jgi:hypothetical protein
MCIFLQRCTQERATRRMVEDLIPAGLELTVVEAGESAFEYGLKASQLNRGSVKAR